ncbi:MAG: SUMF1/EgtB/PvdO family nonheme iron enzyme [Pirellulales bacterium]|nr:SUMF1/EgtB/PvdO family nonheme iron enzyme [Pirellulales bacterium]
MTTGEGQADVFDMPEGQKSLEFVTICDPGNAADTVVKIDGTTGYGSVPDIYRMGQYDVTVGQYCEFLNAVAKADPYELYQVRMAPGSSGNQYATIGITRSGNSGSYTYSVAGSYSQAANCPIYNVSWGDAARFCNWLQNGQPSFPEGIPGEVAGSTETGAYTLNGDTSTLLETRNPGALYFLPSEDEWHKAAYYDPHKTDEPGYWKFATKSDVAPSNVLSSTGTNNANYWLQSSGYTDPTNYLTPVGAFASSPSAYGTFDMSGNVFQWTDGIRPLGRTVLGGSWVGNSSYYLASTYRASAISPTSSGGALGFRVACVPEPSAFTLLALAALGLLVYAWRRQ